MKVRCIGGELHNKFVELQDGCMAYVSYKDTSSAFPLDVPLTVETETYRLEAIIKDYKRHLYLVFEGLDVQLIVDALNSMNESKNKIKYLNVRGVMYEQL